MTRSPIRGRVPHDGLMRLGGTGLARRETSERWTAGAGVVALVSTVVGCVLALTPPAPHGLDTPAAEFSAARASAHVDVLATGPRPPGSPGHVRAREYVLAELASLGWRTEVQQAVGAADRGSPGVQSLAAVTNVVATLPGTAPTGTVLLAAHYDTVAGAPGAGDDGVGVGAVLEAARALTTLGPSRNDLVVLLTDGEENGLLGAEAFMRERRPARGPTVALNHEARGVTGSPVTFRTSSPNSTLLEVLANAPGAAADSAAEAVFEALPNDTDFTRFAAGGLHGYDTAITGGGAYYHSPLDDPQHLNPSSLQQMGTTTLAVAHELAGRDLADVPAGGEDVVMSVPWGLVRYPVAAELPLALATLVLAGAVVALQRRRRALTVPRATASIIVAIGLLVAAVLGGSAVWWIALLLDPGQASAVVGEPYRPLPYQVAMLLAGVGLPLLLVTFARRLGAAAITSGALLAVALGGCLLAVVLPGASTALAPPALFAALGALVAALLPGRRTTVRPILVTLALVPAVILLGPAVWTGFELGLGSGGAGSVLFLAVLLLLVGPLLAAVRPSRAASIGAGCVALVLAGCATGVGLYANREGATDPRQETLVYALDPDARAAYWVSPRPPRSDWSRSLLSRGPAAPDVAPVWTAGDPTAYGPAPAAELPAPVVVVVADRTDAGVQHLTLRVSSTRGAPTVGLYVGGADVRRAVVAGRDVPVHGRWGPWSFGFLFHDAPADGVTVELELVADGPTVLRVADRSDGLESGPAFPAPPAGRVLVNPHVVVTRAVAV
jgi:hypothetical protein